QRLGGYFQRIEKQQERRRTGNRSQETGRMRRRDRVGERDRALVALLLRLSGEVDEPCSVDYVAPAHPGSRAEDLRRAAASPEKVDRHAGEHERVSRPGRARIADEQDEDQRHAPGGIEQGQERVGWSAKRTGPFGALATQNDDGEHEENVEEQIGRDHILQEVAVAARQNEDGAPE